MGLNNDKDYNVYKIEIFPTWQKIKNENNAIIVEGSKLSIYDILMGLDIKTGDIITGFYAGHTHSIIPVDDCILGPEEFGNIVKLVKEWMVESHVYPYNYERKVEGIRHILLRKGFTTNEIMVCLVISKRNVIKENVDKLITCDDILIPFWITNYVIFFVRVKQVNLK